MNPPVPAALKDWSIPIDQLGEGAKYYKYDPAEAKRLLAAAGYPNGFPGDRCASRPTARTILVDTMQLVQKDLKDVGIDAKIDQKEYGAYIATCFYGKFDSMTFGPQTPFLEPDNFLFGQYYPERAQEPEPHQRPGGGRHARPPAAHVRSRQAARAHLRDPALPGQAAVLRRDAVRRVHRGVGRRAEELRAQHRLRLRRAPAWPPGSIARAHGAGSRGAPC